MINELKTHKLNFESEKLKLVYDHQSEKDNLRKQIFQMQMDSSKAETL